MFARRGLELRLERVNQLSYHQSIPDRILRTGELQVEMGGDTGLLVFDHVPRPAAVQSVITEQIDALRHRSGVSISTGAGQGARNGAPPQGSPNLRGVGGPGSQELGITGDTPPAGTAAVARSPHGEDSVAARLVQLDELRRRGIVTEAEFASKKAELLDRL